VSKTKLSSCRKWVLQRENQTKMFQSWKTDVHKDKEIDQGKISQHIKPSKMQYLKQEQLGKYWEGMIPFVLLHFIKCATYELTQNNTSVCPIHSTAGIRDGRHVRRRQCSRLCNNSVHWSCARVSTVNSSRKRTFRGSWNLNIVHQFTVNFAACSFHLIKVRCIENITAREDLVAVTREMK
jgi:hypothetical protein